MLSAYVCGKVMGLVPEELLTGLSTLNIELEKEMMEQKLNELQVQNADEETIKSEMKMFGIQRANLHGWPNTYSFTKAMAEKLLANIKDCLPVIIISPTVILSTCSEPFPGWIEGVRNSDSVIVGHAKGEITSFPADSNTILDIIPADMVVNSMITALVVHSNNLSKKWIYHIGSSFRNPFKLSNLQDIMYSYFSKNPWVNEDGKPVAINKKIAYLSSMAEFVNCIKKRHVVPKDQVPGQSHRDFNTNNYGEIERAMRMAELYQPYTFFQGIFHDKNAEELGMMAKTIADMDNGFNFNSKDMNWMDYLMNVHIPGLLKHSNKSVRNLAKLWSYLALC
ncbi:hypothetical protein L6164_001383 [Bauhinia variegata]|uniref:Uncharacterized protein n=1 Tax=Bauhinia variegata TaxID=167791 RepID=A0ACB9Q9Y7_BAUVA|nr:hypothetical protein L6164_001383 [Bauhinia variegata]